MALTDWRLHHHTDRCVAAAARGRSQPESGLRSLLALIDAAQRDHAERSLSDFASYREREIALSAHFPGGSPMLRAGGSAPLLNAAGGLRLIGHRFPA